MDRISKILNWKYILIVIILAALVGGGAWWWQSSFNFSPEISLLEFQSQNKAGFSTSTESKEEPKKAIFSFEDNESFRSAVISFIRGAALDYFNHSSTSVSEKLEIKNDWKVELTLYKQGKIKGEGKGEDQILSQALTGALNSVLRGQDQKVLPQSRFLVRFLSPVNFSFIEYNGQGKEISDGLVVVRNLDKNLINERIEEGKKFLYRMMDEEKYGFHKKYYAVDDKLENELHTVYSASIVYTFLYLYDLEKDRGILNYLPGWGDFLLSMQDKEETNPSYGAFRYRYYLESGEKENRFVVGTSALTIFSLLRLYQQSGNPQYLESAKLTGNWLLTMQKANGAIRPYLEFSKGKWVYGQKESLLYNGQVLSALSKLYSETKDQRYYDAAKGIADYFAQKYEKEKGYIEGEYRSKNPISNSWVVMSWMDFYQAKPDNDYLEMIFDLSQKILKNQLINPEDISDYGRWKGAYSSSGNGWINEVTAETYRFCLQYRKEDCQKYKEGVIRGSRYLLEYFYGDQNSFSLSNPQRAKGGVFWDKNYQYVRADSVCHALNGFIRIMPYLGEGTLLSVPESSLREILVGDGD